MSLNACHTSAQALTRVCLTGQAQHCFSLQSHCLRASKNAAGQIRQAGFAHHGAWSAHLQA